MITRRNITGGKWTHLRGQLKVTWGKLTDDDLDQVDGKFDRFAALLLEKYGYTRERAAEEIDRQMAEYIGP